MFIFLINIIYIHIKEKKKKEENKEHIKETGIIKYKK